MQPDDRPLTRREKATTLLFALLMLAIVGGLMGIGVYQDRQPALPQHANPTTLPTLGGDLTSNLVGSLTFQSLHSSASSVALVRLECDEPTVLFMHCLAGPLLQITMYTPEGDEIHIRGLSLVVIASDQPQPGALPTPHTLKLTPGSHACGAGNSSIYNEYGEAIGTTLECRAEKKP